MKRVITIIVSLIMLLGATSLIGCFKTCEEHVFCEWTIIESAKDCTKVGIRERECTVCHEKVTEEYNGEHDSRSSWTVEETLHYKVCRKCGESFSEGAHVYEDGECKCGKEEVILTLWNIPDFVVEVEQGRDANVLLLADTQIIDAWQQRYDGRLWDSAMVDWAPEKMEELCFSYIRSAVSASNPDLIILLGDNIYGEFDDAGTSLMALIRVMDSFEIPWASVYGNHDNESAKGAKWQNDKLENAEYGLFKKGDTDGNGNYSIAIKQGDEITRMFYLMDSNWCRAASNPSYNGVMAEQYGFTSNQVKWMYDRMQALETEYGKAVRSSLCFHIATSEYTKAAAQIQSANTSFSLGRGTIPVFTEGNFGSRVWVKGMEEYDTPGAYGKTFLEICKQFSVDTTFAGHEHQNNTSIMYEGIRWTYVLKTGKYDSYTDGEVGGTKLSFNANRYALSHVYCD